MHLTGDWSSIRANAQLYVSINSDIGPQTRQLLLDTAAWRIHHPISYDNAAVKEISKLRPGTMWANDRNKNKNKSALTNTRAHTRRRDSLHNNNMIVLHFVRAASKRGCASKQSGKSRFLSLPPLSAGPRGCVAAPQSNAIIPNPP